MVSLVANTMVHITFEEGFDVLHRIKAPLVAYFPVTNGFIESHPMYGLRVTPVALKISNVAVAYAYFLFEMASELLLPKIKIKIRIVLLGQLCRYLLVCCRVLLERRVE